MRTLADALVAFLHQNDLVGVDVVGSSMGARLALELARRGEVGTTVALDPNGFWKPWERRVFGTSVALSARLLRLLRPLLPRLAASPVARTLLLPQFSARPWRLRADVTQRELETFADSPSFDAALRALVNGPTQQGLPRGADRPPITIGWGRRDWICFPPQAARALECFPNARLHWFEGSGHFPHWDSPDETARLILAATAAGERVATP